MFLMPCAWGKKQFRSETDYTCQSKILFCTLLALQISDQTEKIKTHTFPPIKGRTCIFPTWLSFTDDTIRQVPHKITCRFVHLFTGNCSFPFRTLYIPESWVRSELPVSLGFPTKTEIRSKRFLTNAVRLF